MACLASIIAMMIMLFYDTILSDRLLEEGISEDAIGKISFFLSIFHRIRDGFKLPCLRFFNTVCGLALK